MVLQNLFIINKTISQTKAIEGWPCIGIFWSYGSLLWPFITNKQWHNWKGVQIIGCDGAATHRVISPCHCSHNTEWWKHCRGVSSMLLSPPCMTPVVRSRLHGAMTHYHYLAYGPPLQLHHSKQITFPATIKLQDMHLCPSLENLFTIIYVSEYTFCVYMLSCHRKSLSHPAPLHYLFLLI